jgi:hypothetical protein
VAARLGGTTDRRCHYPAGRSAVPVAYLTIAQIPALERPGVSNAQKFGSLRARQSGGVAASCLINTDSSAKNASLGAGALLLDRGCSLILF